MTRLTLMPMAAAIKPLLNRLVFYGIETCRGQLDDRTMRVRGGAGCGVSVHALVTTPLERVVPELIAAGGRRVQHHAYRDEFAFGERVRLTIATAIGGAQDAPETIAREYGVLLTTGVSLGADSTVRISTIVPQLALLWMAHRAERAPLPESIWIEDVIEIVLRRGEIMADMAAAPAELQTLIARQTQAFVEADSCLRILRRALPDARHVPALAIRARERFRSLAARASPS